MIEITIVTVTIFCVMMMALTSAMAFKEVTKNIIAPLMIIYKSPYKEELGKDGIMHLATMQVIKRKASTLVTLLILATIGLVALWIQWTTQSNTPIDPMYTFVEMFVAFTAPLGVTWLLFRAPSYREVIFEAADFADRASLRVKNKYVQELEKEQGVFVLEASDSVEGLLKQIQTVIEKHDEAAKETQQDNEAHSKDTKESDQPRN